MSPRTVDLNMELYKLNLSLIKNIAFLNKFVWLLCPDNADESMINLFELSHSLLEFMLLGKKNVSLNTYLLCVIARGQFTSPW